MDTDERSAIRTHSTGTDDSTWSAADNEKRVKKDQSSGYYSRVYGWKDAEGDVGAKSTYKFIHHFVGADGTPGSASTRACSNGIGVLNGGRGGTTIPDADRQGVYNHLARHLRDGDKTVPELKSDESEQERRLTPIHTTEMRADSVDGQPMIVGYAARFNVWDGDPGYFMEQIQPGAFAKTIQDQDVRCLFNHDSNFLLGRKSSGTLRLWEDGLGLWMEVDVNQDDPAAMSIYSRVRRRDITGQSFSFYNPLDIWDFTDEEMPRRTLVQVDLVDVGPVTFPFYEVTSAEPAQRSLTRARAGLVVTDDSAIESARLQRIQQKRRLDETFRRMTRRD